MSVRTLAVGQYVGFDVEREKVYFDIVNEETHIEGAILRLVRVYKDTAEECRKYQESAWKSGAKRLFYEPGAIV